MQSILRLRGRNALSAFRLSKLSRSATAAVSRLSGIHAEFCHFVQIEGALSAAEHARLERLLTYGPADVPGATQGELLLVVPRIGTVSPWSSKATDIARHCGLEAVQRIERGVAYFVATRNGGSLTPPERTALAPVIHDRMTDTILDSFESAGRLFEHFPPKPLATVDLMGGGVAALQRADRE